MKKVISVFAALFIALALAACQGGNVSAVETVEWQASEIYTDDDIESALKTVKNYFSREFEGCTLTKLRYSGDDHADEFKKWAEQYNSDEAIVIYSDFDVDSSGGDGSLMPDSTYTDWNWILVRDSGGAWRHATHGYA